MEKILIPGLGNCLSPDGEHLTFNTHVIHLHSKVVRDLGPASSETDVRAQAGWRDNKTSGIRAYVGDVGLRTYNVETGAVAEVPGVSSDFAQILLTLDGAWWGCKDGGKYIRNGQLVETGFNLAGNLAGQCLDVTGEYFASDLLDEGYRSAAFNKHGVLQFKVGVGEKANWPFAFNYRGQPRLFYTFGNDAVIAWKDGRHIVPCAVPCVRGALVVAAGILWAWTYSIINERVFALGRPWNESAGIILEMPGDFMQAAFNEQTQMFTVVAYNSEKGGGAAWIDVPLDSPRVELGTETPPPQPPPAANCSDQCAASVETVLTTYKGLNLTKKRRAQILADVRARLS